jgi:hypothetical protein
MIGFVRRYGDLSVARGVGRQRNRHAAMVVRAAGGKPLVLLLTMVDLPWAGHDTGCAQQD